ncbi:hypothetical protein BJV77DRAFT_964507 [Russula vinacea]|nr:hypothetical protein BJV77DRAFT_964507 [Russula vinacea]
MLTWKGAHAPSVQKGSPAALCQTPAFVFSPGKYLNSKAGVLYLESGESHVNSRLWTTFDDSESVETEGAVFWRLRQVTQLVPGDQIMFSFPIVMSIPIICDPDSDIFRSVIEHVFLPPKLPQAGPSEENEHKANGALCDSLVEAARDFLQNLPSSQRPLWTHMIKMMDLTRRAAKVQFEEADLQHVFSDMAVGDVFSMHIRAQNAGLIVRRLALADLVQFEVFEVLPLTSPVMSTKGKLLCSYPGPAIQVPADTFMDECFLRQLSSFLVQMDVDGLDSAPPLPRQDLLCSRFAKAFIRDEALLLKRWTAFQAVGSISPTLQPETLDFAVDAHISLDMSYSYLTKMLRSASHGFSQSRFTPSQGPRLNNVLNFSQFTNGRLAQTIAKDQRIAIADFELSVDTNLVSWVATSINNDVAPDVIASCIQQYFAGAKDLYGTSAEDNSIMILTIMDLWVALDTFAIHQCPLLKQYSPEIPSDFLHSLLLHRSSTLKRALNIEEYLCRRYKEALNVTSIFSNSVTDSCFAVKYFHTSDNLQRLRDEIVTHAQQERAAKRAELALLNQTSKSLLSEASKRDHEQSKNNFGRDIHRATCQKCQLEHQAKALKIRVHEWPLPPSATHAQLAVFELSPPRAFSTWRDITYMILRDIGLPSVPDSRDQPKVLLDSFSGLDRWTPQHQQDYRVTIGSATKSFSDQTHYKMVGIPAEESSVLVNNGLTFRLYDRIRRSWVIGSLPESSVAHLCMPHTPTSSPYSQLHAFVTDTQHTPNDTIAAQSHCPKEINLHEFLAFSGLRSGPRLQWLNIARELASPSLSFRHEEIHTLITQAAWQLGPLSDGVREWHVDLGISSFGKALLRELEALLEKIKANWLEEVTVRTIALISSRLLASTTDPDVSGRACALLREARNLTYRWICELAPKLDSTEGETSREGLRRLLFMLAATCFSTFDACSEYIPAIFATEEDFSIAMQCAVIVHDNTPPPLSDDNSVYLSRMLSRHRRLLHYLEPILSESLPLSSAHFLELACASKIEFSMDLLYSGGRHEVHFDLLTGQLLIGGRQLGRLPQEIVEHPTYASILGTRILDVAPADIPGMDFMTRSTVSGYQILFSWNNGDLILRTRKPGESQILQLIPRSTLSGDFPRHFVDEYTHWLDLNTRKLEFRPTGSPWTPAPSNWQLYIHKPGTQPRAILQKSGQDGSMIQLIDIRSKTFAMVSSLLSPLESPEHIMLFTPPKLWKFPSLVYIYHFSSTRIRSSSAEAFQVTLLAGLSPVEQCLASKISLSCALGLTTLKSLCCHDGSSYPKGIFPLGQMHVRWHEYTIDTDLGCLKSNASLSSKLYQCYLHALTSHCLPDPLLGHTGTEEALYMLRSAPCRSFQRLDYHDAKLLELISNLTPDRTYYPPHLQSMATVKWNDLPTLSQHSDFYRIVCSILDHARALEALYDQPAVFVFDTSDRNQLLLNRAAFRNKSYYPSDLQISEKSSSLDDVKYRSRDISSRGTAENVAYRTSWSIWNTRPSLDRKLSNLWDLMNLWGSVGPAGSGISLQYSRYWLEFDAARDWFVIYDLCKVVNGNTPNSRIELSFCLSAAAYSNSKYADMVPILMIFALDERCRDLIPPPESSYSLLDGVTPGLTRLKDLVSRSALPIESTPARSLRVGVLKAKNVERQRMAEYDAAIRRESSVVAESILHQWPDHESVDFREQWFDKSECNRHIEEYIQSISRNIRLKEHVLQLQSILQHYRNVLTPAAVPYVFSPQFVTSNSKAPSYSIRDVLISRTNVPTPPTDEEPLPGLTIPRTEETESRPPLAGSDNLGTLIEELRNSRQSLLQLYGNELSKSHREWLGQNASQSTRGAAPPRELLCLYHDECSQRKHKLFSEISATLAPSQDVEKTNGIAGLWPRITPRSILSLLAQDRIGTIPDQWKITITRYAASFLKYQQSIRLLELLSGQKHEELLREIEAIRNDVLAESTPDWLLVQIEANFMARPVQVAVAREMISPSSNRNISLQLNMGEGKSSVIVPLVASTLADGSNLMFQLLVTRISGLPNRPIFYIPFSRSLRMSISLIRSIGDLYRRCVAEGGVLVVQPEHILSQKLMHVDFFLTSNRSREKRSIAHELGTLQDWAAKVSRDVLDESDEILHVRYQLVYTAGEQMPVDDHPNRWTIIQQVFSRLQAHAVKLHAAFPKMFEFDTTLRGFPIIRILDSAIFREISSLIIDDAFKGGLSNLSLGVLPSPIRGATRRFMAQREVSSEDHDLIQLHCEGTTLFKGILLLRGLLMAGEGILGYVLKERRWRVDYGLDPSRTQLAVPYRAKDVPSLRAEFGHPDVAIALTCLSYYYGGLTKDQLLLCFDLLARVDNPETEYDYWVELEHDLPAALCQLNGVNPKDETQVDELLIPLFSRNKKVVDFYLSQVVFPRAAREFPSKLPTSAWDLVEDKKNLTTGFSGTNDNRYLLPTLIAQEDPDSELGTNALALQHLFRPENDHYECTEGDNGEREFSTAFLQRLVNQDPEFRVLLDIGAQMLELQNEELARHWLSLRPDVSAAIFFNNSDHLTVITPDGIIEPFISSPFNRQLEKCVVYLDDAHTRGTDLRFPRGMRAAVTLGPKVTKDRLLGKGHSVMFFAPGEVDRRIRSLIPGGMVSGGRIKVLDVLRWAMHETCEDIRHCLPYWAQQGLDHHKRFAAYKEYNATGNSEVLRNAWLQPESRSLEEMYLVAPGASTSISPEINNITSLSERIKLLGVTKSVDVRIAEEQEREVNHEVERERHIERPPKVQPAQHMVHGDIREFVDTGKLPVSPEHISPLLAPIYMASALDSETEWSPSPLATTDFITTILDDSSMALTEYLRPVNWILSSGSGKASTVIVISPYEANALLPIVRKSKNVRLHTYAPRVTSSMRSFSDLTSFSIPDSPTEPWSAPAHRRIREAMRDARFVHGTSRSRRVRNRWVCAAHVPHGEKLPFREKQNIYLEDAGRATTERSVESKGNADTRRSPSVCNEVYTLGKEPREFALKNLKEHVL